MKTSLVVLALLGVSAEQIHPAIQMVNLQAGESTAAAEVTKMVIGLEKSLEWIGALELGDVKKVIEIRGFLLDLTQLMSIVTYAAPEFNAAVVDFAKVLNQYYAIAQTSDSIAKLTAMSIEDAADYAESIEELDDAQDRIDTWDVVVKNIASNATNVQEKVDVIFNEATSSNANIMKALGGLKQMISKTKVGLESGTQQVQQAAIAAQGALDLCEEQKAAKKTSRFQDKNPFAIVKDGFESIVDNSIDPCIAKERNVRRTMNDIKVFEQGQVKFNTEIYPNLKASVDDLVDSMSEFKKPENLLTTTVKVDATSEPGLTAVYKTIHTEATNVKIIAEGVSRGAQERKAEAQSGLTRVLQNMSSIGNMIMLI